MFDLWNQSLARLARLVTPKHRIGGSLGEGGVTDHFRSDINHQTSKISGTAAKPAFHRKKFRRLAACDLIEMRTDVCNLIVR